MFAEAFALVGHLPLRSSGDTSSIKVNAASQGSFLLVSTEARVPEDLGEACGNGVVACSRIEDAAVLRPRRIEVMVEACATYGSVVSHLVPSRRVLSVPEVDPPELRARLQRRHGRRDAS